MELVDCASFILVKGNKFLAEKRSMTKKVDPGAIEIPGGHFEGNETPEQALEREVQEELSVKPTKYELLCNLIYDHPKEKQRVHYFLVKEWVGEIKAQEAEKLVWLKFNEYDKVNVSVDRQAIEIYLNKKKK